MSLLHELWLDQDGQGLVEYGLILALIVIAIIVVFTTLGDRIKDLFGTSSSGVHTPPVAE